MKRMHVLMTLMAIAASGCVSTPQTKALFTPIGAIGVHSFAPVEQPRVTPSEADRVARVFEERSQDSAQ
ncbi:MAG: hypothetical protein ACJ8OJ_12215 [Povalibacter sp.]